MHVILHNHLPRRRRAVDAPAGMEHLKRFLSSPRVSKDIAREATKVLGKHTIGLSGHVLRHEYILPAVNSAVFLAVQHLGGGTMTEAAVAAVAGYAVTELMKKLGLTPEKGAELLGKVAGRLVVAYRDWAKQFEINLGFGKYGKAHDAQDPVEIGLERLAKVFA